MKNVTKIIRSADFLKILMVVILLIGLQESSQAQGKNKNTPSIYSKQNLIAWCIVPFDSRNRNSEERAQMLNDLGITKLAYDWREKHIPTFDEELAVLKEHDIKLQGFWFSSGPDPANDRFLDTVLNVLARNKTETQLWCNFGGWADFDQLSQAEKVKTAAATVAYVAGKLEEINCSLGLYNHGGWFGEPENQIAIINYLKKKNIGIVYNFSHAETQIDRFSDYFPKLLPHLYAINLTGLKGLNPAKVVPVGQGNLEEELMRIISKSSYKGPIGIINEDFASDAADGLLLNMDGIRTILKKLGDAEGERSYH